MSRRLYVETSALLRLLLEGDDALAPALSGPGLVTSALTFVEASRALSRARRERRIDARSAGEAERQLAAFERSCDVMALDEEVLRRARQDLLVEPVRALHLASVRVLDDELVFVYRVAVPESSKVVGELDLSTHQRPVATVADAGELADPEIRRTDRESCEGTTVRPS